MVATDRIKAIFDDARARHAASLDRLAAGDIRDAAEKAWCATLRATNAVVLGYTNEIPEKTPQTSKELNRLAERFPQLKTLVGRYYSRQGQLHGDCFYLGLCDPVETTMRRIQETAGYIQDAENLRLATV